MSEIKNFFLFLQWMNALSSGEREYYERQINTMNSFEEVDLLVISNGIDEDGQAKEDVRQERAMMISNYANIILLAFKVM